MPSLPDAAPRSPAALQAEASSRSRAVVFAYHNVGVRCLETLLARGVWVGLVITHADDPKENIWFESVAERARAYGIPCLTPNDPNTPEVLAAVSAARADFLFSFYYRHMLHAPLLALAPQGAYNMHGSLLPRYRGRSPVNWAILHGERETGATLHRMNVKPDNGEIVDQMPVPILPDDDARQVMDKVTMAAECVLWRTLPALLAGRAPHIPQDLRQGAYFGGRKAEDGRIDWQWDAARIHNFVRALTHPYPGAYADLRLPGGSGRLMLWRTARTAQRGAAAYPALYASAGVQHTLPRPTRPGADWPLWLRAADGGVLRVIEAVLDGQALDAITLWQMCGAAGARNLEVVLEWPLAAVA